VECVLFFVNLERRFIADALMRAMTVILHFPQPMLIPTFFRASKAHLRKAFFIISTIAALDNPITPRTRPFD